MKKRFIASLIILLAATLGFVGSLNIISNSQSKAADGPSEIFIQNPKTTFWSLTNTSELIDLSHSFLAMGEENVPVTWELWDENKTAVAYTLAANVTPEATGTGVDKVYTYKDFKLDNLIDPVAQTTVEAGDYWLRVSAAFSTGAAYSNTDIQISISSVPVTFEYRVGPGTAQTIDGGYSIPTPFKLGHPISLYSNILTGETSIAPQWFLTIPGQTAIPDREITDGFAIDYYNASGYVIVLKLGTFMRYISITSEYNEIDEFDVTVIGAKHNERPYVTFNSVTANMDGQGNSNILTDEFNMLKYVDGSIEYYMIVTDQSQVTYPTMFTLQSLVNSPDNRLQLDTTTRLPVGTYNISVRDFERQGKGEFIVTYQDILPNEVQIVLNGTNASTYNSTDVKTNYVIGDPRFIYNKTVTMEIIYNENADQQYVKDVDFKFIALTPEEFANKTITEDDFAAISTTNQIKLDTGGAYYVIQIKVGEENNKVTRYVAYHCGYNSLDVQTFEINYGSGENYIEVKEKNMFSITENLSFTYSFNDGVLDRASYVGFIQGGRTSQGITFGQIQKTGNGGGFDVELKNPLAVGEYQIVVYWDKGDGTFEISNPFTIRVLAEARGGGGEEEGNKFLEFLGIAVAAVAIVVVAYLAYTFFKKQQAKRKAQAADEK